MTAGRRDGILAVLAGFVALTFQLLVVKHFAVSVPFWDEWTGLVGFLVRQRAGLVTLHDMFAQHMEHRIAASRVGYILVDRIFDEASVFGNMAVSALLMGVLAGVWAYGLRRLRQPVWLLAATLVVLLSLGQYENMVWSFQTHFYLLMGSMVAAILTVGLCARLSWGVLCFVIAAATVSTLSLASGLLFWPVLGAILVLRMYLDAPTMRDAVRSATNWAQAGAFLAIAILSCVLYFDGYVANHPRGVGTETLWPMLVWAGHAVSFPLLDPMKAGSARWLPLVLTAELAPVAVALVMYARQRSTAKLIVSTGLLLMVFSNVAVMAYGRSSTVWVASRYGTIFLWASVVSLMSLADLMQAARVKRRLVVVCALWLVTLGLVGGHTWRAYAYLDFARSQRSDWLEYRDTVRRYLLADKATRQLPDRLPLLPKELLKPLLDDPLFVRELPWNLRPRGRPSTATRALAAVLDRAEVWFGLSVVLALAWGVVVSRAGAGSHPSPGASPATRTAR